MDISEKIKQFDSEFNEIITRAVNSGIPLDFMANRFASAEFEFRTEILIAQKSNAQKAINAATAGKILHMGDIKLSLPPGHRNGAR